MTTDLSTFSFLIVSRRSEPINIKDWGFLDLDKDDPVSQIIKFKFDIEKISDGFQIITNTNIFISCFKLHQSTVLKGTFYNYESFSTFFVDSKIINSTIVAELLQAHYVSCINEILFDTKEKTDSKNPYLLQVPSLATTILTVESVDYNYNL